ncbi:MAG: CAP domain-containing protein [Acidobacteriaceae bacterium]
MRWKLAISAIWCALVMCAPANLWAQRDEAGARQIFADLNRERAAQRLVPLAWDTGLGRAAQAHTERMAAQNEITHQVAGEPEAGQRLLDAGARVSAFAENVGVADSADEVHHAWMESPGHRANILDAQYNAVGIGAFEVNGRLYATEDFGRLTQAISADDAELQVRDALADARQRGHLEKLRLEVLSGEHCTAAEFAAATPIAPGHSRSIVDYTTAEPTTLPEPLRALVGEARFRSYSVSVCELHAKGFTLFDIHVALFD